MSTAPIALVGSGEYLPVMQGVELPKEWAAFAPKATTVVGQQLDVAKGRKDWIAAWSALFE